VHYLHITFGTKVMSYVRCVGKTLLCADWCSADLKFVQPPSCKQKTLYVSYSQVNHFHPVLSPVHIKSFSFGIAMFVFDYN